MRGENKTGVPRIRKKKIRLTRKAVNYILNPYYYYCYYYYCNQSDHSCPPYYNYNNDTILVTSNSTLASAIAIAGTQRFLLC